ncbi:MAG: hypothetical protein J1E60_04480 [Christensenellaceae bacterium]|nr:hypothetical protein [Christensenellaceae bacterium]
MSRNSENKDIIVTLTKHDVPQGDNEYVCLGHFDCAKIAKAKSCGENPFNSFRASLGLNKLHKDTIDPEGMQRNYLIYSKKSSKGYEEVSNQANFRFMMTISVRRVSDKEELTYYANELNNILNKLLTPESGCRGSIYWEIYYPLARGDIMIMLDSTNFVTGTKFLYSFVLDNNYVLYSYTIPMIKWGWIKSDYNGNADSSKDSYMRLRATVKHYSKLYDIIDNASKADSRPKRFASFGTDDIQFDFGEFSEKELHSYLRYITDQGRQLEFRKDAVFAAELDAPFIVPETSGDGNGNGKGFGKIKPVKAVGCDMEEVSSLINSVYNPNSSNAVFSKRLSELRNIFTVQSNALCRIRDEQFFPKLTEKFWLALEFFLRMVEKLRGYMLFLEKEEFSYDKEIHKLQNYKEIHKLQNYIVDDSYEFIRVFDNALQGYLNSDRQFLEFPGHHVSLYDLPVKLGIVYVNYIDRVIASFGDTKRTTAFLLCPEPFNSEGAHVMRLLSGYDNITKYDDKSIDLYVIAVPADLLFKPCDLFVILAHEMAHYMSKDIRLLSDSLDKRNYMLIQLCFHELHLLVKDCIKTMVKPEGWFADLGDGQEDNITEDLTKCLIDKVARATNECLKSRIYNMSELKETFDEAIKTCLITEIGYVFNYFREKRIPLSFDAIIKFEFGIFDILFNEYGNRIERLFYIVKEGAADIMAIKLLNVTQKDYQHQLDAEIRKSSGKLHVAQLLRKFLVSKALRWTCELGNYEGLLSDESIKKLINYLTTVYSKFNPANNNAAREMYNKIKNSEPSELPLTLVNYML